MGLFQKSVLNKYLKGIDEKQVNEAWERFKSHFHNSAIQENIRSKNEKQYQGEFLIDLFVKVLGYTNHPLENYNLIREQKNVKDAKSADGAIIKGGKIIAVIELKGTDTTNLTNIETQAFGYKNNQPDAVYVITSNFEKLRFYIDHSAENETFNLFQLTREEFNLLWLCLAKENIFNGIPKQIKDESLIEEESVTKKLYKDYSSFRNDIFTDIVKNNPQYDKLTLFNKTQKLLDRFLFILFAEDRLLLPPNLTRTIINEWTDLRDKYDEYSPLYDRFKKNFAYINKGSSTGRNDIFAYNGGLFEEDEILDSIKISDAPLYSHTFNLCGYDFESEVSVNILGHIFEHSLSEIEEIQADIEGQVVEKSKTKRKKDGVFYTPKYITKYIVDNTVGNLCKEKKAELGIIEEEYEQERSGKQNKTKVKALQGKIEQYRSWLLGITICDPACGSGAFLNQALEFLITEHRYIDELQAKLFGDGFVFQNIENSILENNLFGVDINDESIEIAKLSLWLRTAQKGRKLTSLNNNIKCGNSLISDKAVAGDKAFDWENEFPDIFAKGGFDVVIGNPPYVYSRDNKITEIQQKYFRETYRFIQHRVNTYFLFIDLSYRILNKNGYLGFIIPNTWLTVDSFSSLREFIINQTGELSIVNIFDAIFSDANVDTCLLKFKKSTPTTVELSEMSSSNLEILGNLKLDQFHKPDFIINFTSLRNPEIEKLINLINEKSIPLSEMADVKMGVVSYLAGDGTPKQTREDVKNRIYHSNEKIDDNWVQYFDGKDINRYLYNWSGQWIKYGRNLARFGQDYLFMNERILIKQIPSIPPYCMNAVYVKEHFINDINSTIISDFKTHPLFILSILNSKLLSFWFVNTFDKFQRKIFPQFKGKDLKRFPIPIISEGHKQTLSDKADSMLKSKKNLLEISQKFQRTIQRKFGLEDLPKSLQDWHLLSYSNFIKELTKRGIKISLAQEVEWEDYFNNECGKANSIKTKISQIDREIDQMVYALYELTPEEIEIVESQS